MKDVLVDGRLKWSSLHHRNQSLSGLNDIDMAGFIHEAVCFAVRLWLFFDLQSCQEVAGSRTGFQSKSLEDILREVKRHVSTHERYQLYIRR